MRTVIIMLVMSLLSCLGSILHADTIHVPSDQPTIQAGIDAAIDGDTVLVADGTYTGTGNRDIDFNGKAILIVSENGPDFTIIDCEGSSSEYHRGFYFHNGEDTLSVLDGFSITNGYVEGSPGGGGGGILADNSSPTIKNCICFGNHALEGGGLKVFECSAIVTHCEFTGNTASGRGGGVMTQHRGGIPIFRYCVVTYNISQGTVGGGGIHCDGGDPIFINCTVSDNSSPNSSGGGLSTFFDDPYPSLVNCIFWNNSPDEIHLYNGGIDITYSDIAGDWEGEGNIDNDPLFVGGEPFDYHLTGNSPCIDAGDPDSPLDPDGTRVDMGALYFHQGGFTDVTSSAGVGDEGLNRGVAWGDYNNDGFVDLYVCNMGEYNVLYRNNGDGTFEDVSFASGTAHPGDCVGSVWGDYDNDGDLDLFLANSNNQANVLFRNNGDGVFTDVTVSAGLIELTESRSAAWGDYDKDGFLDLFIANRDENLLYNNLGDGTFENVTDELGMEGEGDSRGSSWGDYDNDGDLDLYIANGGLSNSQNELYKNNGDGTFTEVAEEAGVNDTRRSQGIAWGDYNNDGFLDIYVTNGGYEGQRNTLYENNGDGTFTDVTNAAGIGDNHASVGVAWGDFGNDGFLDLYVVNRDTANVLYINNGESTFTDVSDSTGVADKGPGRGVALADFENDGGLDIYVANLDSSNVLYKNIDFPGSWLYVKTVGMRSNKDGVGANVRVFSEHGICSREVCTGTGFGSMNSLMTEIGLGEAGEVDSLYIKWPSGVRQRTNEVNIDQMITIEETWSTIEASPESIFVEPGETFGLTLAVENASLEYPTIKLQVSIIAVLNNGMEITVLRPVPRFGFSLPADGRVEATFGLSVPENLPVGFNCTLKSVLLDYGTGFRIDYDDTYTEVVGAFNENYLDEEFQDSSISYDLSDIHFVPTLIEDFH